jgi:hypothetical protein
MRDEQELEEQARRSREETEQLREESGLGDDGASEDEPDNDGG